MNKHPIWGNGDTSMAASDQSDRPHVSFLSMSQVKMNSINWSAPNIWVFIAQFVEHCSVHAEAMGLNSAEALRIFSGLKFAIA